MNDPEAALWPILIVQDRYQGVYTGGRWVAIPWADRCDLESTVWSDDVSCADWAYRNVVRRKRVGVGDTPEAALADLYALAATLDRGADGVDDAARLREAIRTHRARVTADPSATAEAEEALWAALEA
jgi:hypothetical protein